MATRKVDYSSSSSSTISLRRQAYAVNRHIYELCRDVMGQHINAITVNFYRSTNIVELAIFWNKKRGMEKYNPTLMNLFKPKIIGSK